MSIYNQNAIYASGAEARNETLASGLSTGWKQLLKEGVHDGEDFKNTVISIAKEHGIAVEDMIAESGSFEESLKQGWVSSDILQESIYNLADKFGGLSEEELKAQGYTRESIKKILKLREAVEDGSISLVEFAEKMSRPSGRELIFESLYNILDGIGSIIGPIKEAFRDIFPAMTGDRLYALVEGLAAFTEKLKISDKTAGDLKSTFKGIFAIFDVVGQAVGFLAGKLGELIHRMLPGTGAVLEFTGGIGEFLAGVAEACRAADFFNTAFNNIKDTITKVASAVKEDIKGMMATPFFQELREGIETAEKKIREAFDKIVEVFGKWDGIDLSGAKTFVDGAVSSFRPFTALGNGLSNFFGVLKSIFEKAWPYISKLAALAAEGFGKFAEAVSNAFRTGGFEAVLDLVNAGLVGGILFGIRKFIDGLSDITGNAKGFTDGISSILNGVGESLSAFTGMIKAKTLQTIAVAIAILTASLVVLSLIDPVKLTVALAGITTLFADLCGAMMLLQKGLTGVKLSKLGGELVLFSAAILILSIALKSLSELSWEDLARGAAGITVLIAELVAAAKIMSSESQTMMKGGVGLIAMAAAILILTQAVKSLAALDWDELAKGLAGVGVLLAEVAGFTQIVKPEKLMSTGVAMIAMGTAMLIFAHVLPPAWIFSGFEAYATCW